MDLFLFPESATLDNGYGIGVDFAYKKLAPKYEDIIVWNTNNKEIPFLKDNDFIIKKPSMYSFKRISNILQNKYNLELSVRDLSFLKKYKFDNIHADEVVFYRALRQLYPKQHLTVRFHNCFSRILDRKYLIDASLNLRYRINLHSMYELEKEIFNDRNVKKIFISEEDMTYYKLMMGYYNDAEVWPYQANDLLMKSNRTPYTLKNKLVWIGGVEAHKKRSIDWFISDIFYKVRLDLPFLELHLFGKGTEQFNNPDSGIWGHGFYNGSDIPYNKEALFINPDIIGGGIKLKLLTYLNSGVPFISTPYGFEGYSKELIDNKYCFVVEMDRWTSTILSLFKQATIDYESFNNHHRIQ